jgi:hypothetical protein
MKLKVVLFLASILICSCASTPPTVVRSADKSVVLVLVPVSKEKYGDKEAGPAEFLALDAPASLVHIGVPNPGLEADVWQQCGVPENSYDDKRIGFVPLFLIGVAVDYIFDAISKELAAEIAKYQTSFSAAVSTAFYDHDLRARFKCLRFTRYDSTDKKKVNIDLIAKLDTTHDYLQIIPLRLYYGGAKAKSEDNKYALGVNVELNSIWEQGNEGKSSQLPSTPLLAINCNLGVKDAVWYANQSDPAGACKLRDDQHGTQQTLDGIVSPKVPYSVGPRGNATGPGVIQLKVTASEVGTPSKALCAFASLFNAQKSNLDSALVTAIDAKFGAKPIGSSGKGDDAGKSGGGKQDNSNTTTTSTSSTCGS